LIAKATKQAKAKPRQSKRPAGRPSDPARGVGREALLAAACELLQTMPPNELSFAKIARLCGADPSLISYHFQDRLGLLIAVAEKLTTEHDPGIAVQAAGDNSVNQFRARMGRVLDLEAASPFFHRLMLEELLLSDQKPAHDLLSKITRRGLDAYREIFDRGATRGELAAVDAEMVYVMVVAICQAFNNTHRLYQLASGRAIDRGQFLERYKKFVGDVMARGLASEEILAASSPESDTQ